jgi:hypothetical protein
MVPISRGIANVSGNLAGTQHASHASQVVFTSTGWLNVEEILQGQKSSRLRMEVTVPDVLVASSLWDSIGLSPPKQHFSWNVLNGFPIPAVLNDVLVGLFNPWELVDRLSVFPAQHEVVVGLMHKPYRLLSVAPPRV